MRIFASSLVVAPVALCLLATRGGAQGQLLASEPASLTQTVDGTKATVTYSRPRARGRTGLFGTQIKWGSTWTPGANFATRLEVSKDVTIEGEQVPKGAYSVWFVVDRAQWRMFLDRDTALFHTQPPKAREGQVRFNVPREKKPFLEALTWSVPTMNATGMTLAFQWDTVYVPLHIKVTPSYSTTVAPDVARRRPRKELRGPPDQRHTHWERDAAALSHSEPREPAKWADEESQVVIPSAARNRGRPDRGAPLPGTVRFLASGATRLRSE